MFRPGLGSTLGIAVVPVLFAARVATELDSDAASSRLSMVIAGLIVLAVIIAVSTIAFWRATRPDRPSNTELDIRWMQPEDTATSTWSTAPSAPSAPAPAPPVNESSGPEFGALSPRPADG